MSGLNSEGKSDKIKKQSRENEIKPVMYVFKNMEEYKERGNDIDRRKNRV